MFFLAQWKERPNLFPNDIAGNYQNRRGADIPVWCHHHMGLLAVFHETLIYLSERKGAKHG